MENKDHTADVQVYQLPVETQKAIAKTQKAIAILSERTAEISKTVGEAVKIISDATAPLKELAEKATESIKLFRIEFSNEYEAIQIQFNDYFTIKGIIRPKDIDDFLLWLSVKNPDKLMWEMIDEAKEENNYKLYHEYKDRRFNDSGWNIEKELQYWSDKESINDVKTETANFTVLQWATIFHYAVGLDLPDKSNEVRIQIKDFIKKHGIACSENSIYNNYYKVKKQIDETFDYKFAELEKIIPFMKKHYSNTINTIKEDINILKNEQS